MKNIYVLLLIILVSNNSFSQNCFNESFEDGSLTNPIPPSTLVVATPMAINGWTATSGTNANSCNLNTCCPNSPASIQLLGTSLTTGYTDPNIGPSYPVFSVFGGFTNTALNSNSSLAGYGNWFCKLNDEIANTGINKISKSINITPSNCIMKFAILPVIQNSTHACCGLSTIKVRLINPLTNSVVPSPQLSLTTNTTCSGSSCVGIIPSFTQCPVNSNFSYTKWQTYVFDLTTYIGLTVKLEVIATDCTAGDHSGYAYFDAECTPNDFVGVVCQLGPGPNIYNTCGGTNFPASIPDILSPCVWYGPLGWPGNGATTNTVNLTLPGVYTVSCSPPGVCSPIIRTFSLNSTPSPTVTLTSSQSTACVGGNTITLTGSPSGGVYSGSFVTGNTFNPASAGNYSVSYTYTDSNGCSASATKSISVTTCATGINNLNSSYFNVELYPQPTKDIVNINLINSYNKNIELKIIDVTGKEIERKELEVSQSKTQFSTLYLTNGIYILQLKNSQGQVAVKRLVVSR